MKKLFALVMSLAAVVATNAQSPTKINDVENFNYSRCNVTIVTDNTLSLSGLTDECSLVGGRFDVNKIPGIVVSGAQTKDEVLQQLQDAKVGKAVLDYWLQFDGRKFNDAILTQRARYNVTDADVLNAQVAKVNSLNVANKALLGNSYIVVITNMQTEKSEKGSTLSANPSIYVYKVNLNDQLLTQVWDNWLDETSTSDAIDQYNSIEPKIDFVAELRGKKIRGSSESEILEEAIDKLEKKIDNWKVLTTIYKKHPLGAKIGKKEGLKNSDRYRAYKVVEDKDGNISYKPMGYVRATQVVDNRQDAMGHSELSNFYQISGKTLREGEFLKAKKDRKFSVSLSGNINGLSVAQVDVDYLIKTNNKLGSMIYAGFSIGYKTGDNLLELAGISKKDRRSVGISKIGEELYKVRYIPVSLYAGIGLHPIRILEIMPNIGIGADCSMLTGEKQNDDSASKRMAYFGHGGVKVGLQVYYPVQLFVRADYNFKISAEEGYIESSKNRFGLSLGAGVRVNF